MRLDEAVAATIMERMRSRACRDLRWRIWPTAQRNPKRYNVPLYPNGAAAGWYADLSWQAFLAAAAGIWHPQYVNWENNE